jgi:protein-tyrosine phosphatase
LNSNLEALKVLIVCTGNICRSPIAEQHLQSLLDASQMQVFSSGTMAMDGHPVETGAATAYKAITGNNVGSHSAQQFLASQALDAALILTATAEHRTEVIRTAPSALSRTFTLLEFAGLLESVDPSVFKGSLVAAVAAVAAKRGQQPGELVVGSADIIDPYLGDLDLYLFATKQVVEATETIGAFINRSLSQN